MLLSIIIVNWNTTRLLEACLDSIYRHAPGFDFESIVIDNASNDFDTHALSLQFPRATIIANDRNRGYAEGNNQGIERASGRYVLLLNPDTEVKNDTLAKLVEFMEAHPCAASAGCRLIRPDGSIDRSVRGFPEPAAVASELFGLSRLFPKSKKLGAYRMTWFDYETEAEVDQPMGSCLILSRKAVDEIGLLDPDFPIFFNEVDWCYRAKQAGWEIYFTPVAEVIHHGGSSTKQVRRVMRRESHRSLARFYKKHYEKKLFPSVYRLIIAAIKLSEILQSFRR
ncbi:MAG: glycosyltransferase family 2 protein [Armatimonadota bacterium]